MGNIKVTNQHIEWIRELLPKMISGEVTLTEAMEIVNSNAVNNHLPEISRHSIKKYSFHLLEKDPEKQEQLKYAIKHNSGSRSSTSIERNRPEVIKAVLEEDLPCILARKITLKEVADKHSVSTRYIARIIEKKLSEDKEKFKKYKEAVKQNTGTSPEKRKISNRKKSRIQSTEIVTNKKFLELSLAEKKKQIIYKFLKAKMDEKENAPISNEENVEKRIDDLIAYFKNRERKHEKKDGNPFQDISQEDVLYMLYRVPNLINYSIDEKINPTIELLENYEGIGYENTNYILKTFPSVIGYRIERKSQQLELLAKENLVDAVVTNPRIFMSSLRLMYAQIQYAKERHHTTDLSNINRNNIFMAGPTMLKLYGTSLDEIKERYPLSEEIEPQQNIPSISQGFSVQQIGKRTIHVPTELKDSCKVQMDSDTRKLNILNHLTK